MLKSARRITTAKGAKVQGWDPQSDDKAEIIRHVMGPSGNLRAPTLRVKDDFIVGFNAELYESLMGKK